MQDAYAGPKPGEYTNAQSSEGHRTWDSKAWITTTLYDETGAECPCPKTCRGSDCAVRSEWLYDNFRDEKRTITLLQSDSNAPSLRMNVANAGPPYNSVAKLNISSFNAASKCPPDEMMECLKCNSKSGFYPVAYSGEFSIEGIKRIGSGLACFYIEVCPVGHSCYTNSDFLHLGVQVGIFTGVFIVLMLLFIYLRSIDWLRMAIDSAAYVEKSNPNYPPREIPLPKPRPGHFAWLIDAWKRDNEWVKEFTTPDEYMLVRWFKLSSRFFFLCSVVCCPVLMGRYASDENNALPTRVINSLDQIGIKRYTLLNARTDSSFIACICICWIISLFLMAMIRMETRKYIAMMWSVDPNKTGIKANAIVVQELPMLTEAPAPPSFSTKLKDSDVKKLNANLQGSQKFLDLALDDEGISWFEKLKHFFLHGTLPRASDNKELRALHKSETVELLISKFESVLGKDCIAFKMLAADTRKLDAAARKWARCREFHTQTMQAIVDLKDTEKVRPLSALEKLQQTRALKEIDSYAKKEQESFAAFVNMRDDFINNTSPASSAVIVFARQMDAVIASQIQVDSVPGQWLSSPAPGNSDVVWHNLALPENLRNTKTTRAVIFATLLVLFFMLPVRAASGAMATRRDTIIGSVGEPVYNVMISIILTIFLVIGHILSLLTSRQTGYIAVSQMDSFGASMYFWLLILNLVIGNLSATPLWEDIPSWIYTPHLFTYQFILRLMNTSSFFLQFVILRCATSPALELIHPPVLLGFATKCLMYRGRARTWPALKKRMLWALPQATPSHRVPAQTMLVFFIGMTYAVVAPMLLPFCAVFFGLFYILWKHNIVYHYIQQYAAGTSMWSWLVGKMYFSLVFSQLIVAFGLPTIGFNTMRFRITVLPLVILTVVDWFWTSNKLQEALKVPVYSNAKRNEDEDEEFFAMNSSTGRNKTRAERISETLTTTTLGEEKKKKAIKGIVPPDELKRSKRKSSVDLYNPNSAEAGKAEMEFKIKSGIWQTYAPSTLWPLAAEKSAGSIFLRKWKHIKARKAKEAELMNSVRDLPDDHPKRREVLKDLELKKQMRDKAAENVLRKSTSPYLKKIREERALAEAQALENAGAPPPAPVFVSTKPDNLLKSVSKRVTSIVPRRETAPAKVTTVKKVTENTPAPVEPQPERVTEPTREADPEAAQTDADRRVDRPATPDQGKVNNERPGTPPPAAK